jgi:subtilisin family serine protease
MTDSSTKQIGADTIRAFSGNTWSGIATGKGVITAIIDSGINYEHRSFRNADGTTRIIGILDFSLDGTNPHPDGGRRPDRHITFTDTTTGEELPAHITRGVEYTQQNIADALSSGNKLRHEDTVGHGTHVAAVAAGNGFQRDRCDRFYPGVAPEADILVVKLGTTGLEQQTLLGVAFAILIASDADKAVVINLSSSRDLEGAHDGRAFLELAIDFMLDHHESNKNVSIVTIAGNSAVHPNHVTTTVPPNDSVTVDFKINVSKDPKVIQIWYPSAGGNQLGCRVHAPLLLGSTAEVLPAAPPNTVPTPLSNNGRVEIQAILMDNFQRISIGIVPPPQGFKDEELIEEWRIDLRNVAPAGGQPILFHGWGFFVEGARPTIQFRSHVTKDSTVGIPGTARNVITVGSFSEGSGLSDFSGRGPTLDGRQKPDITAPGEGITAADADLPGCCAEFWCKCCNIYHNDADGTSEAAPHVTGAAALMLQLNGVLTKEEVKDFIMQNARRDAETGPNPTNLWGAGKLNVAAAVNAVNATLLNPIPAPPPTPTPPPPGPPGPLDAGGPRVDDLVISQATWISLQDRFMNSPGGRFYYALAEKYVDEVRNLINENKKVATVWHRNDGPLLLRLGWRFFFKPNDPLPRNVNDVTVRERLVSIANIIRRFASPALASDIDLHLPVLFQMDGKSINQILNYLESEELITTDA